MDHAIRIDAQEVAIERKMMDRAQREPVHDGSNPLRISIRNDVRGLNEFALP